MNQSLGPSQISNLCPGRDWCNCFAWLVAPQPSISLAQTWKSLAQEGWFDSLFSKRTMFWPCFGKNMIFLLNLHPRRPQTVLPYPLQRLCACFSILAPDAGNFSSMSIQNNKQHFHMPHGYDYFCHGGICIWDKKRQGRRAVGDKC